MSAKRFFIETFGCQMNEHDSEKISGLLAQRGMIAVNSPREADLMLLNTCSVREKAAQKVYSRLGQFKARKEREPDFLLGVVGCVAQQEGLRLSRRVPFVDLVVGTHLYHTLPDLLDEIESSHDRGGGKVATRFLKDRAPVEIDQVMRSSRFRANLTIMEGCNKRCAFCVVPFTRGRERNRPARLLLEDAKRAVDDGYVEILLLGQTVNSYRDPERPRYRFAQLLYDLAQLEGLRRLRFTSPHPREFSDEAIAVISETPVICNHIHLPVQSGSDRVLKRMRRQHTRNWYLDLVERFAKGEHRPAFSTDIIVGFPGETEADFEETLSLVKAVGFESMFSFKYSPRPYTEALPWEDDVPDGEKTRRLMILQRLQKEIQLELHRDRYLGREFEILVEGTARDGVNRYGRTASNKIVNFAGDHPAGSFAYVEVTGVGPNSLSGQSLGAFSSN